MERKGSRLSCPADSAGDAFGNINNTHCNNRPEPTRSGGNSPEACADKPGENFEEMTQSGAVSEGWVHPNSISNLGKQKGVSGTIYPRASGEFASLPSQSNSTSKVILWEQGQDSDATTDFAAALHGEAEDIGSSRDVLNTLKREVFATSALLRALRTHALSQMRGVSAASRQQLAAAVAPLIKSFEMLTERLAAAEAAKEPPPAELQEQHIHPFLFVLAQQQLQHKQQQGLNKQQQLLHQSCMRALASAVLRSLDQLLTVGLLRCRSTAGRRCVHALILSLRNCALQAAQRLHSAPTQSSVGSTAASGAFALGSEAYGGVYFTPTSPAAEEELLLLQCLDLLSNSLLGPSGHLLSDACVTGTIQCCIAVSLLHRASPLLRNAATSRAVAIIRHLFALENLKTLFSQQEKPHQEEGLPRKQSGNNHGQQQSLQEQHASTPPQFVARLESAMSLRSTGTTYFPKGYGLESRLRILALISGLLSHDETRITANNSSGNASNGSACCTGGGRTKITLPPFVPLPASGSPHAASEGTGDERGDSAGKQDKLEVGSHDLDTSAVSAASTGATHPASVPGTRDRASRNGASGGIDREFEILLGHRGRDRASMLETRVLSLRLLCVILEAGRGSISSFPSLLQPLQAQILPLVLQQDPRSAPLMLLSLTLRVVGDFISFFRSCIKDDMERCLYLLLRLSTANCGGPSKTTLAAEAQELALDTLRELCSDSSFGFELMLNYDGDIRRSNMFAALLTLLLQLAAPRVPTLRGAYRFAEGDIEGFGQQGSPSHSLSHACVGTGLSYSDVLPAKTPTQQLSPSGSSPSSVSTGLVPESGRAHHHSAFHLRKAPPRSPLKSSRSIAESGVAASTENVATDAAGVARPAGLSNVNRLALAAVLRLISALGSRCDNLNRRKAAERQQQQSAELEAPKARLANESAAEYFLRIQAALPLGQRRKHKALLSYGAALFNSNTKEAIPQLEGLGLLPTPATPRSTALFLKETRGLDLRAVGVYLSTNKPWNAEVLREFVAMFTFGGVGLVAALRKFLKTFRLPGESQQIERVMEAFADEFFRQQPLVNCTHNKEKLAETTADDSTTAAATADAESLGPGDANANKRSTAVTEPVELSLWRWVVDEGLYSSTHAAAAREGAADGDQQTDISELTKQLSEFSPAQPPPGYVVMVHKDTVFVLSYSIIMLNTDQHNNQVRGKMKVEDFVKNNRGINNGSDLPSFYLQNIYISIRHQEIKLKETALATSPPSQAGQAQKGDAATKEQQQQQPPDIFDILADGWTPAEGAGLGWGAFASPYGGASGFKSGECATAYRSVPKLRTAPTADSCSNNGCARSNAGAEILAEEGLEAEMFQCLWNSGCFSVLRGAFESSLDLRQLEEILCGFVSLARAATVLGQVVALNVIVAELCSYFVYTVPAHSQLILAPVMYLIRCSGASLREEGWGAILELLLRLHSLDLLPPALMNLDDFEGSGGAALPSLCTLLPPQFTPPVSRRDRGAGRKGGGWLGDLTSILFALGDSDDESDGDDNSGAHGQMVTLSEELNFACDGLYVLRASTDFALLPSTLAVPVVSCSETEAERGASELRQMPRPPRYQGDARAGSHTSGAEQQLQRGHVELPQHEQQMQQQENAATRSPSSTAAEDEEFASAKVPYLRLKTVLSQGIHVDAAVAEVLRQIEPISSLSAAVVLLLHIVSGFPPIRQNPGVPSDCPSQSQLLQQQLHPTSAAAASQNRSSGEAPSRVAGCSSGSLTTVTSSASSGTPNHSPSPIQAPEDLGLPCSPGVEQSMLSTYLLDTQRRGVDVDTSRLNSGNISSATCASVGSTATSTQGSGTLPYSLPPPVWSPLRGCVTPQLLTYRAYTDRLFCLELLGALMLSELTPGSLSLHRSKQYGNALLQSSTWLLCAVYLDTFLRRYSIGTAASGVPTPLEVVGLADSTEERQQQQQQPLSGVAGTHADRPLWARAMLDACSKDPLSQATMRSVCNVFQAIGSRRLVDTPTSLPHWELLFIERLVVTVLRICLRLLSDEDSLLLPVYTKTRTTQPADTDLAGCTAATQVAIHHLQLLTLLHPNVFCMHVQRICQSAIILVSRLNLRACSSPLLIQVLLALYQRLVPLPAFQPTAPLPQQLTQPQPQQLARKIIASLSDWVKDPEALALLVLQHRNHYQMLLQTLMALCIYVPPFPPAQAAASSPSEARIEGDAHDKQQHQQNMSSASSYEANCSSLTLLASLIPSVGEALRSKGGAVSACLAAAANAASAASTGGCATWKARLDCQAMWLQSMQVLAIVCSFSARPVKVKALAVLQQMLIRCSRNQPGQAESSAVTVQETPGHSRERNEASQSMLTPATGDAVSVAAAAVDYWTRAAEDPYTWRLCLQLVVFPLLSLRFDYPYTPPPPGDAPPPPPQLQHHHNGVNTGDSMFTLPAEHDPLQHQRDLQAGMPWMALPTRRRLTPEAAIATLGLDEVYQRKAAAASLACRLFLTKMELLLQPFKVKGFYVDFVAGQLPSAEVSRFQGPSGDHPGGIEGLLPPLTQLVQLLVTEAKQAPVVYRDAFLESMKNTLLVVLTCPFVAASPIPSDLKTPISPASVLPVIFVPKQQQQQQLQRQPDMSSTETQEAQASDEAAQGLSMEEALLRMLSFLTDSQRLVVSAVSPFVVSTFPKVVQELLLILPTPQPPSTHPVQAHQEASDEHRGNSGTTGAPDNVGHSSTGSSIDSGNEKCITTKKHVVDVGSHSATSIATADRSASASL